MITIRFDRLHKATAGGLTGARILDVGCGSGRHVAAGYTLPGAEVVGVDVNPHDLHSARDRLRWHDATGAHGGGRWHLAAADVAHLPFPASAFDLVICSEVLEHLAAPDAALRELLRVLKTGRHLALSVPRYLPERICWAFSSAYRQTKGGHVRIFRRRRLLALLRQTGALPWCVHHAHSFHTPYWWLKCLVGPEREDHRLANAYHRALVWEMMHAPPTVRRMERLLDPLLGKSLVIYARKA